MKNPWNAETARARFEHRDERIRVWTIHDEGVLDILDEKGVFRPSWSYIEADEVDAVRWLAENLNSRWDASTNGPPVWTWIAWQPPKRVRPDLRTTGHLPAGTKGVRLELSLPASLCVPVWFQPWIAILNRGGVAWNDADDERIDAAGDQAKRKSWHRVFQYFDDSE